MKKRRSGILLHPTSLPGPYGIGDLGPEAFHFLDFLKETGTCIWQMLPLGPTGAGNSPYTAFSAFAGNELLLSPQLLAEEGLLEKEELEKYYIQGDTGQVSFGNVKKNKHEILEKVYTFFCHNRKKEIRPLDLAPDSQKKGKGSVTLEEDLAAFQARKEIKFWLSDYCLYRALKENFNDSSWYDWPGEFKDRDPASLGKWVKENPGKIQKHEFAQYLFFRQWYALKSQANAQGIFIFGDIPIFVAYDSADVWAHKEIFLLDKKGKPKMVAGVPPDYFSSTGQLWGNPLYNWTELKRQNYRWWLERFRTVKKLVDWVRIDHFRGFESFWEIPGTEKTAINGKWKKGPGVHLFHALKKEIGDMPIVAEDLGVITPEVEKLRDTLGFPGMKILQFAFGGDAGNFYLPHNHTPNSVVYTGTHDNDTTIGWYENSPENVKRHVRDYLGLDETHMAHKLIRTAYNSVCDTAIIPIQDLLELDSQSRMNTPSVAQGNWQWRMCWENLSQDLRTFIRDLSILSGRNGQ
jgi:4-alpha-glucanotransferase